MPELPEVEIYSRYFRKHGLGQKIAAVRVRDERVLGDIRPDRLARELRGRAFRDVRRHGKHLFADAGGTWLHLHFGMTGDLAAYREDEPRFARVIFDFTNGKHLAFEDMRLFGVVDLTPDPGRFIADRGLGRRRPGRCLWPCGGSCGRSSPATRPAGRLPAPTC